MAAGEGSVPFPNPINKFSEDGEAWVVKQIDLLVNPLRRERLSLVLGDRVHGDFIRKVWKRMTSHIVSFAESDIVGEGRNLDAGDVAVLVRAEVIQWWAAQHSGLEGPHHGEDNGSRSDAGVDGASKETKLELVAHHEKGEISDCVGDLLDRELESAREGIRLDCELESVLEGPSGSRSAVDLVEAEVGADLAKVCPPIAFGSVALNSPQPVCDFALMNGTAVPDAEGVEEMDGAALVECQSVSLASCSKGRIDVDAQLLVPALPSDSSLGVVVSRQDIDSLGVSLMEKRVGSTNGSDGKESCRSSMLNSGVPAVTPPARDNAKVADCLNARVESAALAEAYLPPAPGVGLQEWVRVAKDSRKGKKMNARPSRTSTGNVLAASDPFPPLARDGAAGAKALAKPYGDGKLGNFTGGPANDVHKHHGVNNFSWQELLRTRKPEDLGVDLHYVMPSMIDVEPCAVFTSEEEAENLRIWQHTLNCYVVGKSPTYYQFLKTVNKLWKPPGGVEVFMPENGLFYCRFASEEDISRVIKNGPWYMEGKLIVVKKFVGDTNCEENMLSSIPIWVKLPCLPVKWWSIAGVSKVVSVIGQPLYFDVPSASMSRIAYARCCVEVAMDRDLPSWINCIGGDRVRRRQKIEYDWVPKKCSNCKLFGHLVADCNLVMNKGGTNKVVEQGKHNGAEQIPNIPRGFQQSEWENPKGSKSRTEHRGAKEQSKLKMGTEGPMSTFVEECPTDMMRLGAKGVPDELSEIGSKGKHLLVGSDEKDHVRASQQPVSEDEESGKDQGSTSSKEEMIGSGGVGGE